ncbi:MAG: hypothetical protein HOO67_08150 [Candidatus Peribacteraceae bacterium]|nr:hypothetical protein [Candidatus Peribacteraceae bacterium]
MPLTNTNTDTATLPTGEQIYNAIMAQIEPDLVTTSGVTTDAPIAGETPENFSARLEKYRKAFALYEKCFNAFVSHLQEESKKARLATRVATEQKLHDQEEATAEKLLADMTHS